MWKIVRQELIGGIAHDLDGEVEEGEHGASAAGVALVMREQSTGERLGADEP